MTTFTPLETGGWPQVTRWTDAGVGLNGLPAVSTALGVWAPGLVGVMDTVTLRLDALTRKVASLEERTGSAVVEGAQAVMRTDAYVRGLE